MHSHATRKSGTTLNGMRFVANPNAEYLFDYERMIAKVAEKTYPEIETYRELFLNDLWFVLYFILRIPNANHPWVVKTCREVQEGPKTDTLDLWAREHFKSSILTSAEPIQYRISQQVLHGKEETIGIFAYNRPTAKGFLRGIKSVLEGSEFLKDLFPDVLYKDPQKEAPKWSEDDGLILRRQGFQKESCFEGHGLIEGMPTGKHFTHRIYDDISTADLVVTPETTQKVKDRFYMSENLGKDGGTHRVVGTIYDYNDVLVELSGKTTLDGKPLYFVRKKPATDDGTPNGKPVLLSEKRLERLKANPRTFATQQLLDPSPVGERPFEPELLIEVAPHIIPGRLYKFLTVDTAGDAKTSGGRDAWAIILAGVVPRLDEIGLSDLYILDAVIERLDFDVALSTIVNMVISGGMVYRVGVESMGASMFDIHVANALRSKGRIYTLENKNLVKLQAAGRSKQFRIESNLSMPFKHSKIKISTAVPFGTRERLREELKKFPYWHDDGLDALAYIYELFKDFRFSQFKPSWKLSDQDKYKRYLETQNENKWMYV